MKLHPLLVTLQIVKFRSLVLSSLVKLVGLPPQFYGYLFHPRICYEISHTYDEKIPILFPPLPHALPVHDAGQGIRIGETQHHHLLRR